MSGSITERSASTQVNFSDKMSKTHRALFEKRQREVEKLLKRGINKEPFNPIYVVGVCFAVGGEKLEEILKDHERIAELRQQYYLDHPEIRTNERFAYWYDNQE